MCIRDSNSGIGSNGLTSARHDALGKFYAETYKESYDNSLDSDVVYIGKNKLTETPEALGGTGLNLGQTLLSPTRTFAPVLSLLLQDHFDKIHGLIHCSSGGQTKCLKYLPANYRLVKDNLFTAPPIFKPLQANSGSSLKEMFEVFNMGCRLEVYCRPEDAAIMIAAANSFDIEAQIVGRVEAPQVHKELIIQYNGNEIKY